MADKVAKRRKKVTEKNPPKVPSEKQKGLPASKGANGLPVPSFLQDSPEKRQFFDAPQYGISSTLGFEQRNQDEGKVSQLLPPRYKLELNGSADGKS